MLFEDDEDLGQTIDLGIRMLDVFLDKVPMPERVLGVEVPFVIELEHPVTGEIAALPLIGGIDAIVGQQPPGRAHALTLVRPVSPAPLQVSEQQYSKSLGTSPRDRA